MRHTNPPSEQASTISFQDFLTKFKGVRKSGKGFIAKCPAHDDSKASLSMSAGDKGIIINCHAGCTPDAITTAVGLSLRDLFNEPAKPQEKARIEAVYNYRDETGALLFQVVRKSDKTFPGRKPDGHRGFIWNLDDVRRVLYRLPELLVADASATVWIPEGEKDVDRLHSLGLTAITNPHGAGSQTNDYNWRPEYSEHLRGREVIVLPDNDEAGRNHAEFVASALHGIAASVKVLALPNLPEKGDVSNWLDAGGDPESLCVMAEAVEEWKPGAQLTEATQTAAQPIADEEEQWELPAPFYEYTLPEFPVETLTDWLREFVTGLARETQTPVDSAAMMALATCSAAVARKVRIVARSAWSEPLNIFVVPALPSGNRKTAVLEATTKPLSDYEAELIEATRDEIAEAECEYRMLEKQREAAERASATTTDDEQRKARQEEAREKARQLAAMKVPVKPRLIVGDVTSETLASLLAEQDGRIAMFSDEAGIFDVMAGRYSNGAPNIDVYLKGHSGGDLRVDRRGRSEYVRMPALTIGLLIQPGALRGIVAKSGNREKGLPGRFLYSLPQSTLGKREIKPEPLAAKFRRAYTEYVMALAKLNTQKDEQGQTVPILIRLTPEADDLLATFERELEPKLGDDGDLGTMSDWGGKLSGAIVRLAGILHLCKQAPLLATGKTSAISDIVDVEALRQAIEIGRYLIPHARAAYTEMGADEGVESARRVLRWIERSGSLHVTKRDIFNNNRHRFKSVNDLQPVLEMLEAHGYVRELQTLTERRPGRKPSPIYEVSPYLVSSTHNTQNTHNAHGSSNSAYCAYSAYKGINQFSDPFS